MKNIFSYTTARMRALKRKLVLFIHSLTKKERIVFIVLAWIFLISSLLSVWEINRYFLVEIPAYGGSFEEGIIGIPRFVNPVLAISDADRDLSGLVYSGLMRATEDGTLINDLAESYTISDDGLTYTFTLKDGLTFHDGAPITADDVEFTVKRVQDPAIKSPKRASWDGIGIQKVNGREIQFILGQPYAPFLENTTLGILPKHIWGTIEPDQLSFSQFNIEPVGSGPYKVRAIKRNNSGMPIYYDFVPFKHFSLGKPYIKNIRVRFYSNEEKLLEAIEKKEIKNAYAIDPQSAERLKDKHTILTHPLPRVFGVFFNQNQAIIFTDAAVRGALDKAIDKDTIIKEILFGYGSAIEGPIPPGSLGYELANKHITEEEKSDDISVDEESTTAKRVERAIAILEENGWKRNEEDGIMEKKTKKETRRLEFSISTSQVPELKNVAEKLKAQWESIGAKVEIKVFETSDLNQNVIRPRKYDALLFGEIIGRSSDLFAFWHSSQRNDPGLNIASYANITVDKLLEDIRTLRDQNILKDKYGTLQKEIMDDLPAIFIYTPDFIYIVSENIHGIRIGSLSTPSDRFLNVYDWYIETDSVWRIFAKNR